jgi:hypothetical protein
LDDDVQLPTFVGAGELTEALVNDEPPMLVQAPGVKVALVVLQIRMQLLVKQSVAGVVHWMPCAGPQLQLQSAIPGTRSAWKSPVFDP